MGGWLGSCHCLDLPFVFGAKDVPGVTAWTGSGPAAGHLITWVQQRWPAFTRTGEPAHLGLDWPHHDAARRSTMIIGKERVSRTLPSTTNDKPSARRSHADPGQGGPNWLICAPSPTRPARKNTEATHITRVLSDVHHRLSRNRLGGIALRYRQRP
jgi:hypothetical protein